MLAQDADEVMKPLTRYDDSRTVKGVFHAMSPGGNYGFGWGVEVVRVRSRSELQGHAERGCKSFGVTPDQGRCTDDQ
ncbi:hypothetical protein KMT30_31505 [Streptomyces sp. IBSBF 2953]|uniref:hypothetical protein n=1 Tax=Streptomyces scabiei TaxID=1930 RepID=UPI00211A288E|nr:hypothetical protein [Streptomyces scabiei]MCQ9183495.1 hypothetical protein [Streptomyces hayashii]MDX3116005.1 hypothetical protein [Streptomyces scabiei]